MFYIFLIWGCFFFFAGHETCAFANELPSFLFLIGQLLFSCFSSSRTMEIKAELLFELYIHINSSKARGQCLSGNPCAPLSRFQTSMVSVSFFPSSPPTPFSSRNVVALMIRL